MHKLLDNTFITAVQKEITSVDVMPAIVSKYTIITTPEVLKEAGGKMNCDLSYLKIDVLENSSRCLDAIEYLKNAKRWMGSGEISVIVNSMILSEKGIENYVVTDDKRAR